MELKPGERIDDLQLDGLHILQKKDGFRFGTDAVLLADFTRTRPRERIADLGTGTGILPLLLSHQQPDTQFEAIELQPDMADMAGRSVELNGLSDRIRVHAMDLRQAPEAFGYEKFHAVVCNPPYGKQNGTLKSQTETVSLARHERDTSIGEIVKSAGALLRTMGRLTMVFPAQRFLELCDELRRYRLAQAGADGLRQAGEAALSGAGGKHEKRPARPALDAAVSGLRSAGSGNSGNRTNLS